MELDQPPKMVSILVFCNHFLKCIMVYVTPDQTAKTVAKFLWQAYISISGALAKFLSSWAYRRLGLHLSTLKPMDKLCA